MQNPGFPFFKLALALFLLLASTLQQTASAQDDLGLEPGVFRSEKLEMIVKAGFGKLEVSRWSGNWTAIRISIANQGEPINGKLVVISNASNQNTQGREFVKPVQLPTGSRQFHEISAFLTSGEDVEVSLLANDKMVATTTLKVERQFSNDNQLKIAVIDNDSTTLNNITNMQIPLTSSRLPFQKVTAENSPQQQEANPDPTQPPNPQNRRNRGYQQDTQVRPIVIAPEDLPRDFVSYDPIDVVVINDAPLSQLSEDQARALKLWVASGGMLIVTGGVDAVGLHTAGLDGILPVDLIGSASVPALGDLTDIYGPFDASAALLLLDSRLKNDGRAIIGSKEKAIIAESKYGSGLVRFVAYNPKLNPYRSWTAARHLWVDLLMPVIDTKSSQPWLPKVRRTSGNVSMNAQNFLFKLADIKPTSSNYFLFFLLFYVLAVGPVNYFALKYFKKLDLAWVTIPAVILVFTTASVILAQVKRGGTVASDMSYVELYQSAGIKETLTGLLIRPESKGTEEVRIDGRDSYAADTTQGPQNNASGNLQAERGPGSYLVRIPTTSMTASVLQIRSVGESRSQVVTMREEGTSVRIKNLSEAPMSFAVYASAAGVSDPFALSPGEEKQVVLNSPKSIRFRDWYYNQLPVDSNEAESLDGMWSAMTKGAAKNNTKLQGFLLDELMSNVYKNIEQPIFLGFMDSGADTIRLETVSKRKGKSFYLIHP